MNSILKKSFEVVCRIAVWALTALALIACVISARIFYAPLNLEFATPIIEKQAASFLPGWDVSYKTAQIGWDWRSVKPWVMIDDIDLIDRRDRLKARVPQVRIDVSFVNLFGSAGISSIYVDKPQIQITDLAGFSDETSDSSFDSLFQWDGPPRPEIFKPVTEAFSRFSARLLKNAPRLEGVYFSNASVNIARGENTPALALMLPKFRLDHREQHLRVSAQVDALIADQLTRFVLLGEAEPDIGELSLDIAIRDVSITSVTKAVALPEFFSYLNFPLGLDLQLDLSSEAGLRGANFELTIGDGYLFHEIAYPVRADVEYGVIAGALNVAEDQLVIDEVDISLGPNRVTGDGQVYWTEGEKKAGLDFDLNLDQSTVEEVKKYWPIRVHPDGRPRGARAWVADNMLGGTTENIAFKIKSNPDGSTPFLNGSLYELTFDVTDVDTYYVKTMPPLEKVKGRAVLTHTAFDVFVTSGTVMGLPVGGSVAHMSDIHIRDGAVGEFDVAVEGAVRNILDLVDRRPVFISDKIGLDLDRLSGNAKVQAKLSLPLIKRPPTESVLYDVTAYIKSGSVEQLLGGEGLRNADLTLSVDSDELTTSGFGDVNGVPMELYWREDFAAGRASREADTSLLVMSGTANEDDIRALGVDVSDFLHGNTRAEATFLGRNLKFRIGYFSADASDATLMVSPVGWVKEPSSPATLNGTILMNDREIKLQPLLVTGEDVDLTANFVFGDAGKGSYSGKVDITKLGRNKLVADIQKSVNAPLKIVASAEVFDANPLLAKPIVTEVENIASELGNEGEEKSTNFELLLHANTMHLLNGESLGATDLSLNFQHGEPKRLNFRAEDAFGETRIDIETDGNELQPLLVSTDNAGRLLRGLGLFSHMEGGNLTLVSKTDSWGNSLKLIGALTVNETKLIAQKTLGSEVTEGVISGLDEYLEDGSVELDVAELEFSYEDGLLDMSNLKANGPALGMTMEGQIQAKEGKINVNGVVVPAYGLNSLLGKIPLVGSLFSGGAGKGLFGVTYRVKGLTKAPVVSVNPLSGLAPGFLRILFEGRKGKVSDVEDDAGSALEREDPSKKEKQKGSGN